MTVLPGLAWGADTIYVDLSGVDGIPGLTADQKQELKDLIKADIQANFDVALGSGNVTVTDDAGQAAGADRQVHINDDVGTHARSDGTTGYHYGEWEHGSTDCNVHIRNFTERHGDDYKTGGQWDLDKLRKGIGRTAAHELAHSYSVGHNSNGSSPDKMTEGGLVSSSTRADTEWVFDSHTGNVLQNNLGKPPCATTADYDEEYIQPVLFDMPLFPFDPDEVGCFDAMFQFNGPMASQFDFGWYGQDSDGGLVDGNSEFDFIYKSSMSGVPDQDATQLTFFEEAHDTVQFLLRGVEDGPFSGDWLTMADAILMPNMFIVTPAGEEIFQLLTLGWDLDPLMPGFEVEVVLDALAAAAMYPEGQFNGWRIVLPIPLIPGDANHDGCVNVGDLGILAGNYGMMSDATWEMGDFNGDGMVNVGDLGILAGNYGFIYEVKPVPEPATLGVLILGGLAIIRRKRIIV
jgi:hypothetical protein